MNSEKIRNYTYNASGLIVFVLIFFQPFIFETNDDNKMMMLVSGSHSGFPEGYAVYLHPLLSEFLAGLYRLLPDIPWYPILWFTFFYLAYVGWIQLVTRKYSSTSRQFVLLIAFLSFAIHSLYFLQFTVVAGVLGMSGFLLVLSPYLGLKISNQERNFGYFLCLTSMLVRKESFFLCCIGFGILTLLSFDWKYCLGILWKEKFIVLTVLVLLLITPVYERLGGYKEYVEFNNARSDVLDHPVLHDIEIDEGEDSDLFYAKNWYFRDNPSVTVEAFKNWKRSLNTHYLKSERLGHSFDYFIHEISNNRYIAFLGLIYLVILFFPWGESPGKNFFILLWGFLYFLLNYFFMVHARVQSVFILMILGAIVFFSQNRRVKKSKIDLMFSLTFGVVLLFHQVNIQNGIAERKKRIDALKEIELLIPQDEVFFMDWRSWNVKHIDPKEIHEFDSRLFSLGWDSYHPADIRLLESLGYSKLQDIPSFYYLCSIEEGELILPNYMNYLQRNRLSPSIVAVNKWFKLIYYQKISL